MLLFLLRCKRKTIKHYVSTRQNQQLFLESVQIYLLLSSFKMSSKISKSDFLKMPVTKVCTRQPEH